MPAHALAALLGVVVLVGSAPSAALPTAPAPRPALRVTAPPPGFPARYTKYIAVRKFPVLGSAKVSDPALVEAAWLIGRMLDRRPDVLDALAESGCRFVVMAADELTTDVPEHADLTPKDYWDRRARGLGPTRRRPAVSCGEENLLNYPDDPYRGESILVHEFAHAIHLMGLRRTDRGFDAKLKAVYDRAMAAGLWEGKYAATNKEEYWAEAVQSYFDTNRRPDHDHNHVRTRDGLAKYDPAVAELVDATFRGEPWRYVRPADRPFAGHLIGYDPATAKRFAWPERLKKLPAKN